MGRSFKIADYAQCLMGHSGNPLEINPSFTFFSLWIDSFLCKCVHKISLASSTFAIEISFHGKHVSLLDFLLPFLSSHDALRQLSKQSRVPAGQFVDHGTESVQHKTLQVNQTVLDPDGML